MISMRNVVIACLAAMLLGADSSAGSFQMVVWPDTKTVVDTKVTLPKGAAQSKPLYFDVAQDDTVTVILTGQMIEVFENTTLPNSPYGVLKYSDGSHCYTTPVSVYTPCCIIVTLGGFTANKTGKVACYVRDAVHMGGVVHVKIMVRSRTVLWRMPKIAAALAAGLKPAHANSGQASSPENARQARSRMDTLLREAQQTTLRTPR